MNYLAHAYLSFNQPEVLVGNMISDFVKGKKKFDYPYLIQQGISLHRLIDSFTDSHQITAKAKVAFKPAVGLYAGAFVDVVYDHFLAVDKNIFNDDGLQAFAKNTYQQLSNFESVMPESFALMFPYMEKHDWLYNYQFTWAIERSFNGISTRAVYLNKENDAFPAFLNNYELLQDCYNKFFPELQEHASEIFATFHI